LASPIEPDRSLWGWVVFSGALHVAIVGLVLTMLSGPVRRTVNYPVYTVELVGGEKLGGPNLGTQVAPVSPPREAKKAKPELPPVVRPEKETAIRAEKEKKVVKEIEKTQKSEKTPPAESKDLPDHVRDKLIQAALERVKQRATESSEKQSAGADTTPEKSKPDTPKQRPPISSGPGEGAGAAAPGEGGRGGGIVKGVEFIVYRNKMLQMIKERWTWVGRRSDLEVTVRFGVREDGEIFGLKVIQGSGDPSFDNSVVRALRGVNPLPPPPEAYRSDFTDVELIFRPADLRG
jgi:colicin import membrane protein